MPVAPPGDLVPAISGSVAAGDVARVLLVGAAGTGKSACLRAFEGAFGAVRVVRLQTSPGLADVPFALLAQAIPVPAGESAAAMVRTAATTLAARPPAVFLIDDVEYADESSLATLFAAPHSVVATAASLDDLPLTVLKAVAARAIRVEHLRPLDRAACAVECGEVLGGPVDPAVARRIRELTEGRWTLVRAMADHLRNSGGIRLVAGVWTWNSGAPAAAAPDLPAGDPDLPAGDPDLPAGDIVHALLAARLRSVDPGHRELVDLLAVCGSLPAGSLPDRFGPALAAGIAGRVLASSGTGRAAQVALSPPVLAEVVRARLDPLRVAALAAQGAAALVADGNADAAALLRASRLGLLAGDRNPPVDPVRAAALAITLGMVTLAEELAREALRRGPDDDAARQLLAVTLSWRGDGSGAEELFAVSASVTGQAPGGDPAMMTAAARAANLCWSCDDPAEARRVLAAAEAAGPGVEAMARLCAARSAIGSFEGHLPAARADATWALAHSADPFTQLWAASGAALARALTGGAGCADEVRGQVGTGLAAAADCAAGLQPWQLGLAGVLALVPEGRFDEADSLLDGLQSYALHEPVSEGLDALLRAVIWYGRGRLAEARLRAVAAWGALRARTPIGWQAMAAGFAALVHAGCGDLRLATELIGWLDAHPVRCLAAFEPMVLRIRAHVEYASGHLSAARRLAEQAVSRARKGGFGLWEQGAVVDAARFGVPVDPRRLQALGTGGGLARAQEAAVVAMAARCGDDLLVAAQALEMADATLLAADVTGRALAIFRAQHDLAGQHRALLQLEGMRRRWQFPAGCPYLPVVGAGLLTSREQDVARYVSGGASNRTIADALGVSVRTVEGHVYRACQKLGLTDRQALAAFMNPRYQDGRPTPDGLGRLA